MLRLIVLASVALSLSFSACGSSEKKTTAAPVDAPVAARPDAEAIVGTWQSGETTITFGAGGQYKWSESRPCGAPPCPTTTTSGTYQFRNGKLYLNSEGDTTEVVEFSWGAAQNGLMLNSNKQGKSWNLMRGM